MTLRQGFRLALMVLLAAWLSWAPLPVAALQAPAQVGAAQRFERALSATQEGRLQEALSLWTEVL